MSAEPRRPLLVPVPTGFVHYPHLSTAYPSVFFKLPRDETGGTPGLPELSVRVVEPSSADVSTRKYVARLLGNEHLEIFFGPVPTEVVGRAALEIATNETVILDFADGTSATGQSTRQSVVFELYGQVYECSLSAYPEVHEKWLASMRELCRSLNFTRGIQLSPGYAKLPAPEPKRLMEADEGTSGH